MSDFKCVLCNDTGYGKEKTDYGEYKIICSCEKGLEIIKKQNEEKAENDRILKEKSLDSFISRSFGRIYISARMKDFPSSGRMGALMQYIKTDDWIYLYGDSRSGKTHLAAAMARNMNARVIKSVDLDILISDYRNENRQSRIDNIACSRILFIDDIGVGKLTQERHSMYYYIIDYRISNGLKTIFTSNYKTVDLWKGSIEVDPVRIITRIQEASKGFEVKNREVV